MTQGRQRRADGLMLLLGLGRIARLIARRIPSSSLTRPSLQIFEGPTRRMPQDDELPVETYVPSQSTKRHLSPAAVPASRLSRLFQYTSLAAGLGVGSAAQALRNVASANPSSSLLLGPKNTTRLVSKLILMRGAALKMGQMLSIQDNDMFPKELDQVLKQVQNGAHYMPHWQLENVMRQELGDEWRQEHFLDFEDVPSAAASIGQVHRATLKDGTKVAVKVQVSNIFYDMHVQTTALISVS